MTGYFQQNIFGGEDEVLPTVPVIVFKHKEKEGRYLAADIELADWEDPDGDVDMEGIENAFIIVRQDLKTPSQIDLDEKIAESETFKRMIREKYGEEAFVSFDVKRWLEMYDPVNIEITPEQYKQACYINGWECKLDEDPSIVGGQDG